MVRENSSQDGLDSVEPPNRSDFQGRRVASLALVVTGVGGVVDIILDQPDTLLDSHILFEIGLLSFALASAAYLAFGWRRSDAILADTRVDLHQTARERENWRGRSEKFLKGLGDEIDQQFQRWELTPAESETALFVLKGLSYKEIAHHQGKSERTVRQHALSTFRKSGLSGRAEFAAFFLEDLLLPQPQPTESVAGRSGHTG